MFSFATDAWTSPNHRVFITFTIHFAIAGKPTSFVLDIVDVPRSHSGKNMADVFYRVLCDFGIENKVSKIHIIISINLIVIRY
jgi:hypothetical protein